MRVSVCRAVTLTVLAAAAQAAVAGPVLVYREGPAFCPQDRAAKRHG